MTEKKLKTRIETDEQEENIHLARLVSEGSGVLKSQFLVDLVEAFRSPKEADEYMQSLGWPNDLARSVRMGVRLRNECRRREENIERHQSFWNGLKGTGNGERQADLHFDFGYKPEGLNFPTDVMWSSAFRLHDSKYERDLPLLLREFKISVDDSTLTSFDGGGGNIEMTDVLPKGQAARQFSQEESATWVREDNGSITLIISPMLSHTRLEIKGGIIVETKAVILSACEDFGRKLPALYKVLRFRKEIAGGMEVMWWHMRQDIGKEGHRPTLCHEVFFERSIPVSSRTEAVLYTRCDAWDINDPLTHVFGGGYAPFIGVRCLSEFRSTRPRGLNVSDIPKNVVAAAMGALAELAQKICDRKCIPLERIAGVEFIKNPPNELIELFY